MLARMRVVDNIGETPGTRRLVLARPPDWSHRPGQVAELVLGPGSDSFFAIASAPSEPELAFLVKVGDATSFPIAAAQPGVDVTVRGPFGAGFDLPAGSSTDLLFIGAGTALAALRSGVVEALVQHAPERVSLLAGVRRPNELAFAAEIAAWRARGVNVRVVASRPDPDDAWSGHVGWVQRWLGDLLTTSTHAFLAGSDQLEDAVEAELIASGVARERIQRNYRGDWRTSV